jgi:two-component system alkaline phosphatase synthesis response regulator PhoP
MKGKALKSGKILIVDDVEVVLKLGEILLKRTGSEIIKAKDGEEAIRKVKTEKPHIVILDLVMPKMQGDVVSRIIKQNPDTQKTTVILLTSRGDETTKKECEKAGVDYFLTKPIQHDTLLEIVRKELKRRGLKTYSAETT